LASAIPNSFVAGQFENPANPKAHYLTTGPEIYRDTDGKVDIFVAGIGTGGTISGTGRYLKEKCNNIEIVGVEPAGSPFLSEGRSGTHGLQGIGAGFIPEALDTDVYDFVVTVTEEQAYEMGRLLGRKEGVLCGISSGAALWAAVELAKKPENKDKNIVVLLPDTGDRYLSTPLFGI
jgi:cysteine synthase A